LDYKDVIAAKAKEVGADTVLINEPLGRTAGVFRDASEVAHKGIYINTLTEVFDMKTNRLIMSVSAETWVRYGIPNTILVQSYVKDLVNKLWQLGYFRKSVLFVPDRTKPCFARTVKSIVQCKYNWYPLRWS
jgi:hypothetical protein